LHISFDVRGGLIIRQIHHWAALLFIAAMTRPHVPDLLHRRVPQAA
jgi:quinol-cytochrome oxidoreductase complex cytochrome b subunit